MKRPQVAAALLMVSCARPPVPEVSLEYSDLFDRACALRDEEERPEPRAVSELASRLADFRDHWRKEAPALLGTTVKLTGVPFRFRETQAALVVCNVPSMSLPLLVNMRPYLVALQGEKVRPMRIFSATVFHELLHRYVSDALGGESAAATPLLAKYGSQPAMVQSHLHVFAILDAVYRKLGREDDLAAIRVQLQTVQGAATFAKAWEIVQGEGADTFLKELRARR
ncbi:MAG TPA: hypothetical protein VKN99_24345 [Polyangia bacterium]|nr:hypothetical protein [Polyangia bacterium]